MPVERAVAYASRTLTGVMLSCLVGGVERAVAYASRALTGDMWSCLRVGDGARDCVGLVHAVWMVGSWILGADRVSCLLVLCEGWSLDVGADSVSCLLLAGSLIVRAGCVSCLLLVGSLILVVGTDCVSCLVLTGNLIVRASCVSCLLLLCEGHNLFVGADCVSCLLLASSLVVWADCVTYLLLGSFMVEWEFLLCAVWEHFGLCQLWDTFTLLFLWGCWLCRVSRNRWRQSGAGGMPCDVLVASAGGIVSGVLIAPGCARFGWCMCVWQHLELCCVWCCGCACRAIGGGKALVFAYSRLHGGLDGACVCGSIWSCAVCGVVGVLVWKDVVRTCVLTVRVCFSCVVCGCAMCGGYFLCAGFSGAGRVLCGVIVVAYSI